MTAVPVLLRHVAFIMDGNGRWAEARGLPRALGHRAGAETVRRVTEFCRRRGIANLTLYAFSTENWARPRQEVEALMTLLADYIESEMPTMTVNDVRLRVLGDLSALPERLRERLDAATRATAGNRSLTLALGINYGGRDEIVRACRALVEEAIRGEAVAGEVTAETLAARLDTAGMPDPDLVIRTAGEQRLSNFLVWQSAYAEFLFTPRCWPDFDDDDFEAALEEYGRRIRKFGVVV